MSNNSPARVDTTRNSLAHRRRESFNPGAHYNYLSDSNDKIVYIHQPSTKKTPRILVPQVSQRRNYVKRLCAGICNFFRFKTTTVGYTEELRYPSPVRDSRCKDGPALPLQSSSTTLQLQMPTACSSLMNYTGWKNEEALHSDDGEYIIYVPKMSRAKLQANFVDPLRQAHFDPVIIHPLCRQCIGCHSCEWNMNRTPENSLRTQTRESSDPGLPCTRKRTRFPTSCRTSMENVTKERIATPKTALVKEDKKASGDGDGDTSVTYPPKDKPVQDYEDEIDSKNTNFLYIPVTSGPLRKKGRKQDAFKPTVKTVSRDVIQERHDRMARNKQLLMQEKKDRLDSLFSVWSRRTKIGKMKKKLAKDRDSHLLALTPPNMLESRFHHIHRLGRCDNQNNSVGRYFDKDDNNVVALKIFSDIPFESTTENLDNKLMAIQEINSLIKMNHKNIVKLLGYFELNDKFHLILESCDHSLREEIQRHPSGLGTSASKKMIKQALSGLHFCHQVNCLHRDLSPENILVCKTGVVKIADFDRSVLLTDSGVGTTSPTPGSFVYNSPEILAGDKKYGLPSDVWSLGVIFCEMLVGRPPWSGKSSQLQLREIHNSVGPLLPRHASIAKLSTEGKGSKSYAINNHAQLQQMFTTISNSCQSFIMKCLDVNPLCRFTCGELLHHHFIKGK